MALSTLRAPAVGVRAPRGIETKPAPALRAAALAAPRVGAPATRACRPSRAAPTILAAAGAPPAPAAPVPRRAAAADVLAPEPQPARKGGPIKTLVANIMKGAAAASIAFALLFGNVHPAEAARSAGRVGGFAGSSESAPTRSYGGGGGGYSGGGGYGGGGYSRGGYSAGYSAGYGSGFLAPSPYYSSPLGPRVLAPPTTVVVTTPAAVAAPAGSDALDALLLMGLAFVAFSTVSSSLAGASRAGGLLMDGDEGGDLQVVKVHVGLLASARDLKNDLDAIAAAADTSSNAGLAALLRDVALALLRAPQHAVYASGARRPAASARDVEVEFNKASVAERSKYSEETLVNVRGQAGVRRAALRPADRAAAGAQPDELIVVTLLVAARGPLGLPKKIDSAAALQSALRALGALPADQVLGVEVVWTPQDPGDSYSRDELIADFPDMRVL